MPNPNKAACGILKNKQRQEIWMFNDSKVRQDFIHIRGVFINGTKNTQSLIATPSSSLARLSLISQINQGESCQRCAHVTQDCCRLLYSEQKNTKEAMI